MARSREEEELLGAAGDITEGVWVHDNGASTQIEDFDQFDPLDSDELPFMPQIVDNDGIPGFRPFVKAANEFENPDELADVDPEVPVEEAGPLDSRSRGTDDSEDHLGDELAARIQQHDDAAVGEASDLVRLARVSEADKTILVNQANFVRISPVSAGTALLGGSATLLTQDEPNLVEVARWTAESPVETLPVTIALSEASLQPNTQPVTDQKPLFPKPCRPFAVVQYGTRAAPVSFEVDIGVGTQFTIGASALNVQVGLEPVPDFAGQPDVRISLAAQLSFYVVTRTTPVTRTRYYDAILALTSVQFTVPYYAKSVRLVRLLAGGTPAYTMTFSDSSTARYTATVPAGTTIQDPPVPISGDIFTVTVSTTLPDVLGSFNLIFDLSL